MTEPTMLTDEQEAKCAHQRVERSYVPNEDDVGGHDEWHCCDCGYEFVADYQYRAVLDHFDAQAARIRELEHPDSAWSRLQKQRDDLARDVENHLQAEADLERERDDLRALIGRAAEALEAAKFSGDDMFPHELVDEVLAELKAVTDES